MLDHRPTESGTAAINGAYIFYEISGEGFPLVLVHSGITDRRMWNPQWQILAEHFRVVRYDLRGFGQSPPVEGPFAHHKDLHALLQFLGIKRAHVMGCSKGGAVCIDFALEHPESVASLILVASPPSGFDFTGDPPKQWDELVAAFKAGDIDRTAELEVQIWVDGPKRTPNQVDAAIRDLVREMDSIALRNEKLELGQEQRLDPPATQRLAELRAPTLIIYGDLDNPNIGTAAEFMAEQIAGAQKIVIEGTAHFPNMERPDEFNQIVLNFLSTTNE